eukprot:TRINITY_DN80557_c0_g1_i1.p1 TRINITY_DN80557_c0_g1~~TRINITY_DN80557_c0_g1_i1.p1  ORF type:complete len:126 (+),score=22.12 TRINITY_DN80557_c0_g1_i1:195-572(+)
MVQVAEKLPWFGVYSQRLVDISPAGTLQIAQPRGKEQAIKMLPLRGCVGRQEVDLRDARLQVEVMGSDAIVTVRPPSGRTLVFKTTMDNLGVLLEKIFARYRLKRDSDEPSTGLLRQRSDQVGAL